MERACGDVQREAAEEFQKTVNAYNEKKTAAQARRDSAQNAVGESKRPVLEELQKEKEVAETEYLEKEKIYNQLRIDNKDDREILIHFHPGWKSENQSWRNMPESTRCTV